MLYVTTRNNRDAFTPQRTFRDDRAADGGFYLPMRAPVFSSEEICGLAEKSFGQNVANVLNRLFDLSLASWDVDFCIGRCPVNLAPLRQRILVAETWRNPQMTYGNLVSNLIGHIQEQSAASSNWAKIAVRIAVLFGIFGELGKQGITTADISVVSGDFSAPISAWYARQWGLPIRNIVCCCNENNSLWDLICQGQMRTGTVSISTIIPEADVTIPENLERLIYACGGSQEVERYLSASREGKIYTPDDRVLSRLRKGIYVSVVSSGRLPATISGVYGTNRYLFTPCSALAYAGLLDYRAKTGELCHALVLADESPMLHLDTVAGALNLPVASVKQLL